MAIIEELPSDPPSITESSTQQDTTNLPPMMTSPSPPDDDEPLSSPKVVIHDQDLFYDAAEDPAHLLAKATEYKTQGNRYFGAGDYDKALTSYQDATTLCPANEYQQRAVYAANMAACYLKLGQPKQAKSWCDTALELDPEYVKAKLRRAQANERLGTSSSALSDALQDYQDLLDRHNGVTKKKKKKKKKDIYKQQDKDQGDDDDDDDDDDEQVLPRIVLDKATLGICQRAVRDLPPKIKVLMEKEKDEMIGKLKDLGNTVLGKFGLSTDNFQFQKDPSSGNYSMNFVNNPSSS
ncbi:hypothetical protein BC941DRAFT_432447 [Chlamydoabsidia padenii]|nr:hypothetical protein BC941DRAFT_432447 [Chlamydoabsidia padenii]